MQKLPLGNGTLEIKENQAGGYDFILTEGETSVKVLSMSVERRKIREHEIVSYQAKLYRDYDDDTCYFREELLSPSGAPSVIMRPDGRLYCKKCRCTVPNTANHEMRKEGAFAHSHICGIRQEGEVYEDD